VTSDSGSAFRLEGADDAARHSKHLEKHDNRVIHCLPVQFCEGMKRQASHWHFSLMLPPLNDY
jgi:hypothetical protein